MRNRILRGRKAGISALLETLQDVSEGEFGIANCRIGGAVLDFDLLIFTEQAAAEDRNAIEVARDTATNLEPASGGLHLGAGSNLEPGTCWSGLIDDVRIYNRAVKP